MRVAGSLKLGAVRACDLVRALRAGSRTSELAKAIVQVGSAAAIRCVFVVEFGEDEAVQTGPATAAQEKRSRMCQYLSESPLIFSAKKAKTS